MTQSITEGNKAFHNLFCMSCSMRAELDRLLTMAKAYPHLEEILAEHYDPAVDADMVGALGAAMQYIRNGESPPTFVLQQLYRAAVPMLDKLDSIERDRLEAVKMAGAPGTSTEQRRVAKLVEDFNVNVGEVNLPARNAIEAIRPYLQLAETENSDGKAVIPTTPDRQEPAGF